MLFLSRKALSCESVQLRGPRQYDGAHEAEEEEDPSKIQSLTLLYEFEAVSALSCHMPCTWLIRVCWLDSAPFLTSAPLAFR